MLRDVIFRVLAQSKEKGLITADVLSVEFGTIELISHLTNQPDAQPSAVHSKYEFAFEGTTCECSALRWVFRVEKKTKNVRELDLSVESKRKLLELLNESQPLFELPSKVIITRD